MPTTIENPILNSPFAEPTRHFKFDDDGITSEIAEGRRRSTYFIPTAKPKVKGDARSPCRRPVGVHTRNRLA